MRKRKPVVVLVERIRDGERTYRARLPRGWTVAQLSRAIQFAKRRRSRHAEA
jgi:hypothetical protein